MSANEPTATDVARAQAVAGAAKLLNVVCHRLNFEVHPPSAEGPAMETELKVGHEVEADHLVYAVTALVMASGEPPDGLPDVRLDAHYAVVFKMPNDFDFSSEEAEAFGNTTVPLVVVPYLRELASSMTARAGLPQLTLPLATIPLVPGQESDAIESDATVEG